MNRFSEAYDKTSSWWLQHPLYDPASIFVMEAAFEESYVIRAGLRRLEFNRSPRRRSKQHVRADVATTIHKAIPSPAAPTELSDAIVRRDLASLETSHDDDECRRLEEGAFAYCDRVVSHQGIQGPPPALFMGYGMRVRDGVVDCCCVADQASVASGVLDTLAAYPDHPRAAEWLACIEGWADWVIREFATDSGGIGVGVLSHKWNPISEYWCATSLFAASLFKLATITGKDEYARRGMGALSWMSRFDYENVSIPTFNECAPEVILYASEGIVEGLKYLASNEGREAAGAHPAADKFRSMAGWLVENQDADGRWPEPIARGYRDYSLGVPWILLQMAEILGDGDLGSGWHACARRCLSSILQPDGQRYYGMYVRPWSSGLAWLSLGTLALAKPIIEPVAALEKA